MKEVTNQQILAAFAALERLGQLELGTELIWRLALNHEAMMGKRNAIEKARRRIANKWQVTPQHTTDDVMIDGKMMKQVARLDAFTEEWDDHLEKMVEWTPDCTISYEKFVVKNEDPAKGPVGWKSNELAALISVGIVDPPADLVKKPEPPPAQP